MNGERLVVEFPFGSVRYLTCPSDPDFAPEEFEFITYVSDSLPNNPTIYDVGAHVGHHTVPYSLVADCVVAIEPLPVNRERLQANLELNDCANCDVYPLAFCETSGPVSLEVEAALSSEDEPDPRAGLNKGGKTTRVSVEGSRLDDFVLNNDVPTPDGIKIDVEGAEHDVIKGAVETLQSYRPDLFVEIHTNKLDMYNVSLERFNKTLSELGYTSRTTIRAGTADREWLHYQHG